MRTALRFLIVLLSIVVTQISYATEYTFTGNGSWTNLSNWKDGLYPGVQIKPDDLVNISGHAVMGICPTYPNPSCEDVYGINLGTINIAVGGSLTLQNQNQFGQSGIINVEGTLINQTVLQGHMGGTINVKGTFLNQIWFGNQGHLVVYDGGIVTNEVMEGITHQGGGRGVFTNDFINPGKITINSGGTINNVLPGVLTLGDVTNNGGTVNNYSTMTGNPVITGNLLNMGTIAPGNSPGIYTIKGNYMATTSAMHKFEVGGITEGTYDQLKADGTVKLSGTLFVTLINGFSSSAPHQIPLVTGTINGTFSNVILPPNYSLIYNANSVVLNRLSIQTVTFYSIRAFPEGSTGKISWWVADEADVIRYEVERSTSGGAYETIGTVAATKTANYSFMEQYPAPVGYYRVKCIYANGIVTYSAPHFKYHTTNVNVFSGPGNWSDATKWSLGSVPTDLLPGQYLFINGDCQFDLDAFTSEGKVEILMDSKLNLAKGQVINKGELVVWGTLENNAERFENVDTTFLFGTILNNSFFANTSSAMSMQNGSTFINSISGTYSSGIVWMTASSGFVNYGRMSGISTIFGNFLNESTMAPGNSPGTFTVRGNYTASASAKHDFEVDGLTAGTNDILKVERIAYLNGDMNIILKPGVTISGSTEIPIITGTINGTFSSTTLPDGLMLEYKAGSVVLKAVTPLPVRFVSLDAAKQNSGVQLSWKVADEKGVLRYEIERSTNGNHFNKIGMMQAALKDAYHYIDYSPHAVAYYRVKSIDADGRHGYSPIVFLKGNVNNVLLKAFITASGNELMVQHPTAVNGSKIYIHSIDGKLLKVVLAQNGTQQSSIAFPFTQSGVYVISIENERGFQETTKIYKP